MWPWTCDRAGSRIQKSVGVEVPRGQGAGALGLERGDDGAAPPNCVPVVCLSALLPCRAPARGVHATGHPEARPLPTL